MDSTFKVLNHLVAVVAVKLVRLAFIIQHTEDWNEPLEIALWSYQDNNTTDETVTITHTA